MRTLYFVGFSYILFAGGSLLAARDLEPRPPARSHARARRAAPANAAPAEHRYGSEEAKRWFAAIRPSCNALEVSRAIAQNEPPAGWDGAGYAAACYALGGRLDDARRQILNSDRTMRAHSAAIVFEIGHPVADAGDDVAAGPIMDLVLEFWPDNYQALYHAGMSDYAVGFNERAVERLEEFRRLYRNDDFFGRNADKALGRLAHGLGPDTPHPGAH